MLPIKTKMKVIFFFSPLVLSGCITASPAGLENNVDLAYQGKVEKLINGYNASVASISIVNLSQFQLCVFEDVFVNDLSPYVTVKKLGQLIVKSDIPNPPKSSKILRLEPGKNKTFERVIDYRVQRHALAEVYVVSVELSFCNDGKRFTKSVKID